MRRNPINNKLFIVLPAVIYYERVESGSEYSMGALVDR